MHRRAVFAALSLLIPWTRPALAATPWTRVGPDVGVVTALAPAPSSPSTVYAGTNIGGVFRSRDGGATWSVASAGLPANTSAIALAVDVRMPETVWAGTLYGIFRSLNGGASWDKVSPAKAAALAQDPASRAVYAGSLDGGPMLRSRDGGATWQEMPRSPKSVSSLAIDRFHPQTLYAAGLGGVLKSTNGGAKWFAVNRGLSAYATLSVTLDPSSSRRLYVAAASGPRPLVFRSDDGGARWTAVSDGGLPGYISSLTVQPGSQETVWVVSGGQVLRSLDRGLTWSPAGEGLQSRMAFTLLPGSSTLLAGTAGGVFRSEDQGASWSRSSQGLRAASITGLALDPFQPARLWAATPGEVYRTSTGGGHWTLLTGAPSPGVIYGPLAAASGRQGTVYLGLVGGLARTEDAGGRWSTGSSLSCLLPFTIAVDPASPSVLYVGSPYHGVGCGDASDLCPVFRSDDSGQSWTCIREGLAGGVLFLAVDPLQPSRVYALVDAGIRGRDVYASEDRGASWSLLAASVNTEMLVPDPYRPGTIWGGSGPDGILRSDDGGRTWTPWGKGIPRFTSLISLALDPTDPDVLYAGSSARGVFKSSDGGLTWSSLGTGLDGLTVRYLVVDPQDPRTVYAGTDQAGVLKLQQPGS